MSKAIVLALLQTALLLLPLETRSQSLTAEYQSYLAHIAAANSALRLNETAEAKRWLASTPNQHRGWEWNYLNDRSDVSIGTIQLDGARATKVSYSNDGKTLVTTNEDGAIVLYDASTMRESKRFMPHNAACTPQESRLTAPGCSRVPATLFFACSISQAGKNSGRRGPAERV